MPNHMLRPILILAALVGAQASPLPTGLPTLMPMPSKVAVSTGQLRIDSTFRIAAVNSDRRLDAAIQRLTVRIFRQAGLSAIHLKGAKPTLTIECREPAPELPA